MSFVKISEDDIETFTIATNPIRSFSSSSASGPTGSIYVFPRRSSIEKDTDETSSFVDTTHNEQDINGSLQALQASGRVVRFATGTLSASFTSMVSDYMDQVNAQQSPVRKQKVLEIDRITPSYTFTENTLKKLFVKDVLMKHYRVEYPSAHFAYTNYNTLNFFTASGFPTSSALLYPNLDDNPQVHDGYVSGSYSLSGAFSFDFYINPRYTQDQAGTTFKAGTLLHLSSSYAVSLISGSSKDKNGYTNGYRLQLQLSHSADIRPSLAKLGSYPSDLVFLSDDNALKKNHWHHVVIRWGTNLINQGTGSFNIDGIDRGIFVVPSGTITPKLFTNATRADPDILVVGNYYEGNNDGVNAQAYFFANDPSTRDGLELLINDVGGIDEPVHYSFNHPLNAEIHDLAIKRYYMSDFDIVTSSSRGPSFIDDWTAFYLPPFFVQDAPFRQFVGDHGGILQTPFFEVDGTTTDPFDVAMSFGVAGHYVNIENYLRDFSGNVFPRVHHLTGVAITYTTDAEPANQFIYDDPFAIKRNSLIMPCDDGLFVPSFQLLASESVNTKFVDDLGSVEYSFVNLDNILSSASLVFGTEFETAVTVSSADDNIVNQAIGFSPENPGMPPGPAFQNHIDNVDDAIASGTFKAGVQDGAPLTIFQRTRDGSSNEVVLFDISNLYYGIAIHPKTLVIRDISLSGTSGKMSMTLKDDGHGNVYRADCETSQSAWNSVGNVFYNEGIIIIKNPHIALFGKEQFEISFRGEQNVHSTKFEVIARTSQLNSSSNPNYKSLPASGYITDTDPDYVWIDSINFHDSNYNVVMKTQLAQPIMKRFGDQILFKCALDF